MSDVWEIISLRFAKDQAFTSYVNREIAKCPGYEPFDSYWEENSFVLLLKRKVVAQPLKGEDRL